MGVYGFVLPAPWWLYRRRALGVWAAVALGAWVGVVWPAAPWLPLAVGGAVALVVGRRGPKRVWGALFLVSIALAVAAFSAVRVGEYQRWEAHYPRGERRVLRGRVADVLPHSGSRLALLVEEEGVSSPGLGAGRLWVRLVADPAQLLALLEEKPPGPGGTIAWPVRLYPFSPRGNPGEFDARLWAMRRGYLATAYLDEPGRDGDQALTQGELYDQCPLVAAALHIYDVLGIQNPLRRAAWRWRCLLTRGREDDTAAVAIAILLGQKDLIGADLQHAFSRSGLGHLLAVSGLHVGFILALVLPVVQAIAGGARTTHSPGASARRVLGILALAGVVLGYVALTGAPASASRAGLMAIVAACGTAFDRRADPWQTLGVVGSCLLLYQPLFLFDLGFQMSFLAVAGILAALSAVDLAHNTAERHKPPLWERINRAAKTGLVVTLGAQIATAPAVAFAFSSLSWVAPVVNLAGVPLGAVAVPVLAVGAILADIGIPLGHWAIDAGHWLLSLLIGLARALPPWAELEVPMPSPLGAAAWLALWFGAAIMIRALRRPAAPAMLRLGRAMLIAGALLGVVSLSVPVVKGLLGVAEVWVLDVGQGDAILVRSGWGRSVLIDGGGVPGAAATGGYDVGERRLVPALKRMGVRRLAAVINTHPHEDHVHGLAAVIAQRRVEAVYASAVEGSGAAYRAFLRAARAKGLEVQRLSVGEQLQLEPGLTLTVLASGDLSEWEAFERPTPLPSVNDRSVALLLEHPGGRTLFLGDLEARGQRRLMAQGGRFKELSIADVDVLLVPHHGDRVTRGTGLLDVVRPKIALISVGPNRYGHPSAEVLEALAGLGARIARTDRHGAILVQFWPWGVRVATVRRSGGAPL